MTKKSNGEGMLVERIRKDGGKSFQLRWHDGDGQRHCRTMRGTKKDALAELRRVLRTVDTGDHVAPDRIKLGDWVETWLTTYAGREASTRTQERYSGLLRKHVVPAFGATLLQKLAATQLDKLYGDMAAAGLSRGTVRYVHVVLGSCLRTAVDKGLLTRSPSDRASPPSGVQQSGGRSLTQIELRKLVAAFEGTPHFVAVALAAETGARVNELLALPWSAVDFARKTLRIDRALKPTKAGVVFGPTKTARSRRTIRIDEGSTAFALLKSEHERQEAEQAGLRGPLPANVKPIGNLLPDDALVFPASALRPNAPRGYSALSHVVPHVARKLGLGAFRFHDLRHTHASLLLQAGVPVHAVSARLGHADAAITLKIYAHVMEGAEAEAAAAAGNLLVGVLGRSKS